MRVDTIEFVNGLEVVHNRENGGSLWLEISSRGDGVVSIQVNTKRCIRIIQTRSQLERLYTMLQKRLGGFE